MATAKSTKETPVKMSPAQLRKENERLKEELQTIKDGAYCYLCGTFKKKDAFYVSTDPMNKSGLTPICKLCAKKIALRVDKNGDEHEPTKDSVRQALEYLNKPFLNSVWDASVQESENLIAGKTKSNVWTAYIKNIAMVNYVGMVYKDSDMFKQKIVYDDEIKKEDFKNIDIGNNEQYIKDKSDVIRLLHYDPFEKESIEDQPFLYSQLLGLLDQSEDANDDMMRISSCITIVRNFLQISKIDNMIAELMGDVGNTANMERNLTVIKPLQESKQKISAIITNLAAESCISLKNNKNAKKGENTWTGKIKKIKDLNLREGEVNGFDIATCRGMQQVMNMSNASILKQLRLDESEYSDMIAEQRTMIVDLRKNLENYKEISRILLRENLDLKDFLEENNMLNEENLVDLNKLYSCFSEDSEEVVGNEDTREAS